MLHLKNILLKKRKQKKKVQASPTLEGNIRTEIMSTPQVNMPPHLTMSAATDIGTRTYQQDYYAVSTTRMGEFAAIVCDGMGGLEGSEQASKAAATVWIAMYEAGFQDFGEFADRTFSAMDRLVRKMDEAGGTTAAAIWIDGDALHWMSIGDSKIYILRNGKLEQLTREHNYQLFLDGKLERGEISLRQHEKEMDKGASLVSYIGRGQMPFTDVSERPICLIPGDIVLVCSDGLYKSIPEEKLEKMVLSYSGDFDTLASYLVDYAAATVGIRDNTTVVAVRCNEPCCIS
ncbi:MAG: serine/threonine-protein phosphatase [Oscillospiraceae bacterium]|nr:serine/threonine-protein phosphatase [Oscillospiraceae bacterium]